MEYMYIYYYSISYLPEYLRKTYPNTSGYRENDDDPVDFQLTTARSPRYAGDAAVQQDEELVQGLGRWGKWITSEQKKNRTLLSKFGDAALKKNRCQNLQTTLGRWMAKGSLGQPKSHWFVSRVSSFLLEPVCSTTVELWSGFPEPSFTWCFPHHRNIWTTGPDQLPTDTRANWASQTGWLAVQLLLLPAASNAEHRRTDFSDLQNPQFFLL